MTWWSAWSPWLKFIRATFIPAFSRAVICSSEEVAGPRVQTILARRFIVEGLSWGRDGLGGVGGGWVTDRGGDADRGSRAQGAVPDRAGARRLGRSRRAPGGPSWG